MQAIIVFLVGQLYLRESFGHKKAPAIPDIVDVMDSKATAIVPICNSVRANIMAVSDTVATASDKRNQAMRYTQQFRSFKAVLRVFQSELQANAT